MSNLLQEIKSNFIFSYHNSRQKINYTTHMNSFFYCLGLHLIVINFRNIGVEKYCKYIKVLKDFRQINLKKINPFCFGLFEKS